MRKMLIARAQGEISNNVTYVVPPIPAPSSMVRSASLKRNAKFSNRSRVMSLNTLVDYERQIVFPVHNSVAQKKAAWIRQSYLVFSALYDYIDVPVCRSERRNPRHTGETWERREGLGQTGVDRLRLAWRFVPFAPAGAARGYARRQKFRTTSRG